MARVIERVVAALVLVTTALVLGTTAVAAAGSPARPNGAPALWPHGFRPHTSGLSNNQQSTNWSGYGETGTFTQASGNWVVPNVQPSQENLFSSSWVGIDGFSPGDNNVIQTGTDQNSGPDGGYDAWWEIYPAFSHPLPVDQYPVHPGDAMTASITSLGGGVWDISIQDHSQRWSFSTQQAYSGPGASAEWIEEAPSDGSGVLPLAAFGTATFTNLQSNGAEPSAASLRGIDMVDQSDNVIAQAGAFNPGANSFSVTYTGPAPNPPPPFSSSGYDLVGSDGGVFVFAGGGGSGFYGSLPQLGISVNNIVGMVPSPDARGYFLVGSDGGVFAFGDSAFFGSLPGDGVRVNDIRGIVPTSTNQGYFLVGADGGIFAFGNAPYLGSLPGMGISRHDVIGIAATPSNRGYWVVAADGTVYAFGDAPNFGSAVGTSSPVAGITSTPDGGGYWIVTQNGAVFTFGNANYYGSLPGIGVAPASPVIGLVPTDDHQGYWLIGSDGGIFAFGDAPFIGSLPAMGIRVSNIVGAVPTS